MASASVVNTVAERLEVAEVDRKAVPGHQLHDLDLVGEILRTIVHCVSPFLFRDYFQAPNVRNAVGTRARRHCVDGHREILERRRGDAGGDVCQLRSVQSVHAHRVLTEHGTSGVGGDLAERVALRDTA